MEKVIEVQDIWAEYVNEDGIPTGEAWVVLTGWDGEHIRFMISADNAQRLGDMLVRISSARPRASADNMPNDLGLGI
jgi:hypothetical protein